MVLSTLLACTLSAATSVLDEDTGGPGEDGSAWDTGAADGGDVPAEDLDGDGWTEAEGDCDDSSSSVNPGVSDGCDQVDSDCDGVVDEDAMEDDPTEPNDTVPWDLGDLDEDPSVQVLASLHNDDDLDRFSFTFEDSGWSLFQLHVSVSNIPSGSAYRVVLEAQDHGGGVYLDQVGSGTISVTVDDEYFEEDGGTWELRVSAESGADCGADYLVTVQLD